MSGCKHVFCREDIRLYLESSATEAAAQCPVCFRALTVDLGQPALPPAASSAAADTAAARKRTSIVSRLDFERWQSSTKVGVTC